MGRQGEKKQGILQFVVALIAACIVFAVMQGIHDNYGIMMNGIIEHTGIDYASVSFIIAVGQILYGATQPVFGMIALRKSNAYVLFLGILMMAVGLIVTPLCSSTWSLLLFFGILLPSGTGALCFGIVMGAIAPIIGEKRAAVASGIVQASAGIGDALMSPGLQYLIARHGVSFSLPLFSVPILLTIPAVAWLGRARKKQEIQSPEKTEDRKDGMEEKENLSKEKEAFGKDKDREEKGREENREEMSHNDEKLFAILGASFHDPTYWYLLVGFSTCGFHMAIIETHLFSQYVRSGIPGNIASLTLTVYGIATMIGAVLTGFLGQKFRMKNVLGGVYAFRVLIAAGFILFPKSIPFAFIATGLLGLTGDSTVPPTTGIISAKVGVARMAVVYGSIFIGHQVGAFASAWLGGVLVNTPLSYTALWIVDLCLSLTAAAASFRIRD